MAVSGVGSVGGELGWATSSTETGPKEEARIPMPSSKGRNDAVSQQLSMRAVEQSRAPQESMSAENAAYLAEATAQRVLETGQGAVRAAASAIDVSGIDTSA